MQPATGPPGWGTGRGVPALPRGRFLKETQVRNGSGRVRSIRVRSQGSVAASAASRVWIRPGVQSAPKPACATRPAPRCSPRLCLTPPPDPSRDARRGSPTCLAPPQNLGVVRTYTPFVWAPLTGCCQEPVRMQRPPGGRWVGLYLVDGFAPRRRSLIVASRRRELRSAFVAARAQLANAQCEGDGLMPHTLTRFAGGVWPPFDRSFPKERSGARRGWPLMCVGPD